MFPKTADPEAEELAMASIAHLLRSGESHYRFSCTLAKLVESNWTAVLSIYDKLIRTPDWI
jgi:hypothetical protein